MLDQFAPAKKGGFVGAPPRRCAIEAHIPEVMTVDEVAAYLRIPRGSVYKLAQRGKIPCQKVGRHWRFRREAVDKWLANMPVRPTREGPDAET